MDSDKIQNHLPNIHGSHTDLLFGSSWMSPSSAQVARVLVALDSPYKGSDVKCLVQGHTDF